MKNKILYLVSLRTPLSTAEKLLSFIQQEYVLRAVESGHFHLGSVAVYQMDNTDETFITYVITHTCNKREQLETFKKGTFLTIWSILKDEFEYNEIILEEPELISV